MISDHLFTAVRGSSFSEKVHKHPTTALGPSVVDDLLINLLRLCTFCRLQVKCRNADSTLAVGKSDSYFCSGKDLIPNDSDDSETIPGPQPLLPKLLASCPQSKNPSHQARARRCKVMSDCTAK